MSKNKQCDFGRGTHNNVRKKRVRHGPSYGIIETIDYYECLCCGYKTQQLVKSECVEAIVMSLGRKY